MKSFKNLFLSVLFSSAAIAASAQTKTEKLAVKGECEMCKAKIEKAAKSAGASYAAWDLDSKTLTVKYNSASSNTAKIEKAVAAAGYDTPHTKASDAAYEKLHGCCKYDRSENTAATACCSDAKCAGNACMKEGKCAPDMSCCKDAGCDKKACCKKD